jgi:hypothetical protein
MNVATTLLAIKIKIMIKKLYIQIATVILILSSILIYVFYNNKCDNWWYTWINKTYWYSACIPNNWMWVSPYDWKLIELYDDVEEIWKDEDSKFNEKISISKIPVDKYNDHDWYKNYLSYKFKHNNKNYTDFFTSSGSNILNYEFSEMILDAWINNEVISFLYDKTNATQNDIIESIEILKIK